jgi:uncharacterized membrane protein
MKRDTMGSGAAMGLHGTSSKRVFLWLWHSWLEAQSEVASVRWLSVAALGTAAWAVYLAGAEGKTGLEIAVYGMTAALFAVAIAVIFYLLFEVYRKHRSDAIFDSKRLADLIHKLAKEEVEANEEAKLALENTILMMQNGKTAKK